jgi:hypothetical protein
LETVPVGTITRGTTNANRLRRPTQRWIRSIETLRAQGWPVHGNQRRWRLGELTLDWSAVAPR